MRILTLNTHSWQENDQLDKISQLANFINEQQFDVISLQEVNQSMDETEVPLVELGNYVQTEREVVIKRDNFAYLLLQQLSVTYYWTWVPVHVGFVKYDEGLAILTRTPMTDTMSEYVSVIRDYENYRTRKIIGAQIVVNGENTWFVNGHYGWWHDTEPFRGQWDLTDLKIAPYRACPIFIMGDFNNVAEIGEEGYDYVVSKGWHDLYLSAEVRDEGSTVVKAIAGWEHNKQNLRIDYIFASVPVQVKSSTVALNGTNGPVVSDHYGVAVEL
ncbi:maltose 6'-phosphate phosphatase [Paenibacillus sp. DS2015]|uniref:endonuclease/exonuclease/phosphatase family protein n=1 Tax=Paenibacillus sp. DS2015 TaxID=3373917 RepID=UPI003D246E3B